MSAKQQYADLIQPICQAAQEGRWNEVDTLKLQLDDLLDLAPADAGIGLTPKHMEFLAAHAAIETARVARKDQSLCLAALTAVNLLEPDTPTKPS